MGFKVSGFDFSNFKNAMLDNGEAPDMVDACWADLITILHATEDTGLPHAMTEGADRAFHLISNDTVGLLRMSGALLGAGNVLAHDPLAYGTDEFDAAWENTRKAFSGQGIELPADYRSDVGAFRSAANCLVMPTVIADVQKAA